MMGRYIKYVHEINDPSKSIKTLYGSFFIVFGIIVAILGTYESVVAFIVSFSQSIIMGTESDQMIPFGIFHTCDLIVQKSRVHFAWLWVFVLFLLHCVMVDIKKWYSLKL